MSPRTIVVCGVSGSGKTTVGHALSGLLDYGFLDADDLHDARAVAKMARGEPLDDADRAPWLARVAARMARPGGGGLVVACSALKVAYRDVFRASAPDAAFVLLAVSPDEAARRVAGRAGHFMPTALVASQFEILEGPAPHERDLVIVKAPASVQATAEAIACRLG